MSKLASVIPEASAHVNCDAGLLSAEHARDTGAPSFTAWVGHVTLTIGGSKQRKGGYLLHYLQDFTQQIKCKARRSKTVMTLEKKRVYQNHSLLTRYVLRTEKRTVVLHVVCC